MIGIVCSRADSASVHICEHLRDLADWETVEDDSRADADGGNTVYRTDGFELREFDELHLDIADAAAPFGEGGDPDLLVFASRHSGETGPLLTAHFTGNFGAADHGGDPAELARTCPHAHSRVLDALATHAPEGYEVGMECTHHGPTSVGAPSMFVEVGSAEPQWDDPDAARAVARAILDLQGTAPDCDPENRAGTNGDTDGVRRHLVGLGGGHYAPRFGRIARETDWAVGHVAADWSLDALTEYEGDERSVLQSVFRESNATHAVVDGDHPDLTDRIESLGYRAVGETFVRETANVSLPLVDQMEDTVCPVADGLRFGGPARSGDVPAEFVVESLPTELVVELEGDDGSRVRGLIETHALAFTTSENGNRLGARGAFSSRGDYNSFVDDLVTLLGEDYDTVARSEDVVIARKQVFDPAKASDLGVPEGPKFGELAAGNSVEVDGRRIPPEVVRSTREREFQL